MADSKDRATVWTMLGGLAALATIHVLIVVPGVMGKVEARIDDKLEPLEERLMHRMDRLEDVVRENH